MPRPRVIWGGSETRLATRIALTAAALTLLFVLILGGTSYLLTRAQITEGVETALDHHAALLAGRLSATLGSVVNTLSGLRQNALILNALMDSLTRDTSLKPFLEDFSTVNGVPVDIALTDFEGKAVVGSRAVAGMTTRWMQPVLEGARPYVSIERDASGVYLLVAEPVLYMRTLSPEGALVHRVDLSRLLHDFNAAGENEPVRLLQRGQPFLEKRAADSWTGDGGRQMLTRVRALDLPGLLAPLDLAVEVRSESAVIARPLRELTLVYVYLGLALLVAVIVLSMVAARRLARPLSELEQIAASVVASGSFDHRFSGGGYTEVARLGETFNQMLESLGSAHAQLTQLAHHDVLTGLANRALFHARLGSELLDAQRAEGRLAVLLLDVDHFKDINDTLGHPVGDELLRRVATRLSALVRSTDMVARLGGDEFALIATHLKTANDAAILGEKIITSSAEPYRIFEHKIFASVSIGIAICPTDGDDTDQLLRNADLALYKAKGEGRGHFQFYDPGLNTAAQKRKQMETAIRGALEQSAFRLHYQPKVDLLTGEMVGVEALVRWYGAHGLVCPQEFIPVAEEARLIVPLGEWILREACRQKLAWDQAGMRPFTVAVNLSPVQLRHDEHIGRLMQVIVDTGVDPRGLEIEITESALMERVETVASRLAGFRALGVRLAIDDIGTGYSSLANLKRLSVDVLKIDRSFVRDMEADADDAAIARAVIQLGHSLDLTVVAEGVETPGQAELLNREGCRQAQGFLYSRALDAQALTDWIVARGANPGQSSTAAAR